MIYECAMPSLMVRTVERTLRRDLPSNSRYLIFFLLPPALPLRVRQGGEGIG